MDMRNGAGKDFKFRIKLYSPLDLYPLYTLPYYLNIDDEVQLEILYNIHYGHEWFTTTIKQLEGMVKMARYCVNNNNANEYWEYEFRLDGTINRANKHRPHDDIYCIVIACVGKKRDQQWFKRTFQHDIPLNILVY